MEYVKSAIGWKSSKGDGTQPLPPRAKLKEYHTLIRDAFEAGAAFDEAGSFPEALQSFDVGLQACNDALAIAVPTSGLAIDDTVTWRTEIATWRELVARRAAEIRAGRVGQGAASAPLRLPKPAAVGRPGSGQAASTSGRPTVTRPAAAPNRTSSASASSSSDPIRAAVLSDLVSSSSSSVTWDSVIGMENLKRQLTEAVILPAMRPDLFMGVREPPRGILLFGPPGTGKTLIAKALANEAKCTFFSISASSLVSKWMGEGEKFVRTLFQIAAERAPSVIFMDEVDAILSARRSDGEHEASRRLKTEFLVQLDGLLPSGAGSGGATATRPRVVFLGATNRPADLDEAVRRRFTVRLYVPLPDASARAALLRSVLAPPAARIRAEDIAALAGATVGYSNADLVSLCREAAMLPVRELGARVLTDPRAVPRPVSASDVRAAIRTVRPSGGNPKDLEAFAAAFGTGGAA